MHMGITRALTTVLITEVDTAHLFEGLINCTVQYWMSSETASHRDFASTVT
jgi:hypothetical protein